MNLRRPEIGDVFTWTGVKGTWESPRVRPTFQLHTASILPTLMTNLLLAGDDVNNGILIGWITDDYYIRGMSGGTVQFELRASDGKAYAGGGAVVLDSSGVTVTGGSTTYVNTEAYKLTLSDGSTLAGYLGLFADTGFHNVQLRSSPIAAETSYMQIVADAPTGQDSQIQIQAAVNGSEEAYVRLFTIGDYVEAGPDLWAHTDMRVGAGLYVGGTGTDPDADDIHFDGNLKSMKNSTTYDVYGHTALASPLTSASWDGDAYSTTAKTKIDLSAVFGAPAGITEATFYVECRDSGSGSGDCLIILSPNDTNLDGLVVSPYGLANDIPMRQTITVPCDANGDIYYQIVATGAGRFDVWLRIWGYDI